MERLSLKKKLFIIRLYFEGWSYGEIAAKARVSKGSVSNVIIELKAGVFPEYSDLTEQLDLLRELAVELKSTRLTAVQASIGVTVLTRLQELNVEPGEIEGLSALYRTLNTEGADMKSFIRVALSLEEVRRRTNLSVEELEMKVRDLEETASKLEPLATQVVEYEQKVEVLEARRQILSSEVSELEERRQVLVLSIGTREKREAVLSRRVANLEERAEKADERLATTRKDQKELSNIGISPDDLSGFTQRLKGIAYRHGIKPKVLHQRLLNEFEQLDKGLELETIVRSRQSQLSAIEKDIGQAKNDSVELTSANEQLRSEHSSLRSQIVEARKHLATDIKAINSIYREATAQLKNNISAGVRDSFVEIMKIRDQALEVGRELGKLEKTVADNEWLKNLLALVSGDDAADANGTRVVGLAVLRGISAYLERNYRQDTTLYSLKQSLSTVIAQFERWSPQ